MNVTGANTTNTSSVTSSTAVVLGIRVGVGTASSLSLIGSALIIFTFVAYRDLRTTARQLLVNLSIADFLVASSHLVGLLENSSKYKKLCKINGLRCVPNRESRFILEFTISLFPGPSPSFYCLQCKAGLQPLYRVQINIKTSGKYFLQGFSKFIFCHNYIRNREAIQLQSRFWEGKLNISVNISGVKV